MLASENDTLASALSVVLFLLHPACGDAEQQGPRKPTCNPLLGSKKLLKCLKALRGVPVLPLVAEVPLCLFGLLQACPTLCALGPGPTTPQHLAESWHSFAEHITQRAFLDRGGLTGA